jgi:hypothetical protein
MAGKIFLNYRREDTAGFVQALFLQLEQSFPGDSVFMDVAGGIGAGHDFAQVIEEQVDACDVMLALIGPNWLTVRDEAGKPRVENPGDYVRTHRNTSPRPRNWPIGTSSSQAKASRTFATTWRVFRMG